MANDLEWYSSTCYCIINWSKQAFMKRCKIHESSRNVIDVIKHNTQDKFKTGSEKDIADRKNIEKRSSR